MRHSGSQISLVALGLFLAYLFQATAGGAIEAAKSPIRQLYLTLPDKVRDDPSRLLAETDRMIGRGTSEVATLLLDGVARLANGDVEAFAERLARVKRLRFYKFERPPLFSIQWFVNAILNHMRDRNVLAARLADHPNRAFLHYQMGCLALDLSPSTALPHFLRAVQIDAKYYDAWLKIAEAYENMMDWDRAEQAWERIVVLKPEDFRPFLKVGHMRLRAGDFASAESWYAEGLRKKLYLANYEAFRETIAGAISLVPNLRDERDIELRKIQKLTEAVRNSPNDVDLMTEIASLHYEKLNDAKLAETWCHRAINAADEDWRPYLLLYKIHKQRGDNRLAVENLTAALHECPDNIRTAYKVELQRIVEKMLLEDVTLGRAKIGEIVDYFAMYYE